VYASIAEMGSMLVSTPNNLTTFSLIVARFPTAGGQYFWVSILAPRKNRRYLSYITGWLCAITWQTGLAGGAYFAGTLVQALLVLNQESYVAKPWQATLLILLFIFIALLFNTFLAKRLPLVEALFVFCHVLGVLIFIPVLVLSPRRSGGAPLVDFYNGGGWASNGLATMVGMTGPISALVGFDCSVHMGTLFLDWLLYPNTAQLKRPKMLLVGYHTHCLLDIRSMFY
jgi:amino acid transporter